MRILIAEDDPKLAELLCRGLREEGFVVDLAETAEDAEWMACETLYDVVLLDVMLPDGTGIEVCNRMRAAERWAPVIMVTARDAVADRIRGLDAGADDYLTKPFSFDELLARIRAVLRRGRNARPTVLSVGEITLDPGTCRVTVCGADITLTSLEYKLLEYMMAHAGDVMSRSRLRDHVWDQAYDGDSNVVDVYIRYLRKKIDRPFGRAHIETVRGFGYRLRDDASAGPR